MRQKAGVQRANPCDFSLPRHPTTMPEITMGLRKVIVDKFFEALSKDLFPYELMEQIFGVQAETEIGKVVLGAWRTLWLNEMVDSDAVVQAISDGALPTFFEERVRTLTAATHSSYTVSLVGEAPPQMAMLPAGELFSHIAWDTEFLAKLTNATPGW